MPRPPKGPHLWFDKRRDTWHVQDGSGRSPVVSRGKTNGRATAEKALTQYRVEKQRAEERGERYARVAQVASNPHDLVQIILRYVEAKADEVNSLHGLQNSANALIEFWHGKQLEDVTILTCKAYAAHRAQPRMSDHANEKMRRLVSAGPGTVRRDLGVLQAAMKLSMGENGTPFRSVWLPPASEPSEDYLTRDQVARLLRATLPASRKHRRRKELRSHHMTGKHLRRLILLGVYSGRRRAALCELKWNQVDLETGMIDFRRPGKRETKKRRGRAILPRSFLMHLRRWKRDGCEYVIHIDGKPIKDPKRAFSTACRKAGIEGASVHMLKHTAVTWAAIRRMPISDAEIFFATSRATLERFYQKHAPEILERIADEMGQRPPAQERTKTPKSYAVSAQESKR